MEQSLVCYYWLHSLSAWLQCVCVQFSLHDWHNDKVQGQNNQIFSSRCFLKRERDREGEFIKI